MSAIDGEIPAIYFLITSVGLFFLSYIQLKQTGKSITTFFLATIASLFLFSYFALIFVG
jgi:hypothetical protein|tara:strand:+ start:3559 stop:3735 length:177 start_codon:yes stop_codon:yes gene_type:complete